MSAWLSRDWWRYLLATRNWHSDRSWLATIICRARGHPAGVWWYNLNDNLEPDMHCKNCGDDLK